MRMTRAVSAMLLLAATAPRDALSQDEIRLVAAIESLPPAPRTAGRWRSLRYWMDSAGAPGLSVAVVNDFRVVAVGAYGMADAMSRAPVTPTTLFQAASVSKAVFGLAFMRLVQNGGVDLDAPVNQILRGWQLPSSAQGSADSVTLRRILSHTAGLGMSAVPSFVPNAPLPSLVSLLSGDGSLQRGVRIDTTPGSRVMYSGGGYGIAQLVLEEKMGLPFAQAMDSLVLRPLGMARSTFEQPLPETWQRDAASGHRGDGTRGTHRWRAYNVGSAAGLWTTPTDLARYIIAVQRAVAGADGALVAESVAREMLTPETRARVRGLGPEVEVVDGRIVFGHGGWNTGYRAYLAATLDGRGVVVMANGNNAGELVRAVARQVAQAYGWRIAD